MKLSMGAHDTLVDKFWDKYYKADSLKRAKMIKELIKFPVFKKIDDDKIFDHVLSSLLVSYFDDLIQYMEKKK